MLIMGCTLAGYDDGSRYNDEKGYISIYDLQTTIKEETGIEVKF